MADFKLINGNALEYAAHERSTNAYYVQAVPSMVELARERGQEIIIWNLGAYINIETGVYEELMGTDAYEDKLAEIAEAFADE